MALRQRARSRADAAGVTLLTATGQRDGDNASQVNALETMVAKGTRAILITPSDSRAIVPAIRRARERGVLVIALDSPTDPPVAVDALLATDNYRAGKLIGAYGRRRLAGRAPRIATLDLFPGHPVGAQRHNGFLQGFGLASLPAEHRDLARPAEVVCMADSYGDQARGQTAMENCLQKNADINVVYAINEPAAAGATTALKNRGREREVLLLTIDGSCRGVQDVASGRFTATSQQQPLVTLEDLRSYRAEVRTPLRLEPDGFQLALNPPPAVGGEALAQLIQSLEGSPIACAPVASPA